MPVGHIYPGCINGTNCNPGLRPRPQYLEGFCLLCWSSLTAEQRRTAIWAGNIDREAERKECLEADAQPTTDWEVDELLRALADATTYDGPRNFKDAA